jgi:hypothetical protein
MEIEDYLKSNNLTIEELFICLYDWAVNQITEEEPSTSAGCTTTDTIQPNLLMSTTENVDWNIQFDQEPISEGGELLQPLQTDGSCNYQVVSPTKVISFEQQMPSAASTSCQLPNPRNASASASYEPSLHVTVNNSNQLLMLTEEVASTSYQQPMPIVTAVNSTHQLRMPAEAVASTSYQKHRPLVPAANTTYPLLTPAATANYQLSSGVTNTVPEEVNPPVYAIKHQLEGKYCTML